MFWLFYLSVCLKTFDLNLDFKWHAKSDFSWEIFDMPAMSGGIFAIHKKFFEDLGYYDPGEFQSISNLLFAILSFIVGQLYFLF